MWRTKKWALPYKIMWKLRQGTPIGTLRELSVRGCCIRGCMQVIVGCTSTGELAMGISSLTHSFRYNHKHWGVWHQMNQWHVTKIIYLHEYINYTPTQVFPSSYRYIFSSKFSIWFNGWSLFENKRTHRKNTGKAHCLFRNFNIKIQKASIYRMTMQIRKPYC